MKYIIKVKLIEEYEVEADNKEESIKFYRDIGEKMVTELDTFSKGNLINCEHKINIEEKPIDIPNENELYHIPDGNDYNYTGYRPFSNKDYERIKGTNISYKTDSN